MASHLASLRDVRKLLDECAPGHMFNEAEHYYRVAYRGKIYATLPKGSHSDRGRRAGSAEIELGHIRKMLRFLGIDFECARKVIPNLKG